MITVIFFILIYILIIMTLGFLIYSYIDYLKIVKEIDKAIEEADKAIEEADKAIEEADKAIEEDLKYGLGETKSHYCKGDYICLDENGNITSKSRQDGDW